jgi:hypothetical protein
MNNSFSEDLNDCKRAESAIDAADDQRKFVHAAMAISAILGRVADLFDDELAAWRFHDSDGFGVFLLWDDDAITVQFEPVDPLSETAVEDRERCFAIREYCGRWNIPTGDLKV